MNRTGFLKSLVLRCWVFLHGIGAVAGAELAALALDPRRDATVVAVERVMPSVVNIATRTWVEREHPYERLWRQYYGYQRKP